MLNYEKIATDKHGSDFVQKTKKIAKSRFPYQWLLGIMYSESGLHPQAQNRNTNGTFDTGLIQFNDITAQSLGTNRNDLYNMSALAQLDYVEKFYRPIKGKIKSYGDLYSYNHSLYYFYNPNLKEVIEFKKRVTEKYKADTGQDPDWIPYKVFLKNTVIVILVVVIVYIIFFR